MVVPPKLLPFLTLAAAAGGAVLFHALDLPLAYILGALVGSAAVTNTLAPMKGGRFLRRGGQLFVGASVGAVLSPDVVVELARLFPIMLAVAVASNLLGLLLAVPVARLAGTDRLTGVLSCLPAGMAEMATLAHELRAGEQTVAIVHTLRVVLVLTVMPVWLGITSAASPARPDTGLPQIVEILLFALAAGAIAAGATRLKVLNAWIITPMLLSLVVVAAGHRLPAVPAPILAGAQIAIGASLGLRFRIKDFRMLPRAALAGLFSGIVLIGVAFVVFASLVQAFGSLSAPAATLAVAPGGLGEMIASASALGLLPASVAGFQITRSILTNVFAPLLIRWATGRKRLQGDRGD